LEFFERASGPDELEKTWDDALRDALRFRRYSERLLGDGRTAKKSSPTPDNVKDSTPVDPPTPTAYEQARTAALEVWYGEAIEPIFVATTYIADPDSPGRRSIEMKIADWISEETVIRAFRNGQRELKGKPSRPAAIRNLHVFQFVTEQERQRGQQPSWRELVADWDQLHTQAANPNYFYDGNPRLF